MYPDENSPGYGCFVKNICDALAEHGFIQKYSSVIRGQSTSKFKKILKYTKAYFRIMKLYFKNYDFIFIHYPNQFIPLLYLLRIIKKKKIIVNFHGDDILYSSFGYRKILGKLTESFCKKYANAIVIPSEYYRSLIVKKNLIDSSHIIISPSGGIDPNVFYPSDCQKWTENHVHLGFVGRLKLNKGIMDFAKVCKTLKEKSNIHIKATVIGYGECYNQLLDYINDNNLTEHFNVIKGVSQIELGNYYREMDLFIFNSKRKGESLGLTGLEAMGCGVPVIGSNIGGIATYVIDGYNGWLIPVDDINAIINRIEEWVNLPLQEKQELKKNAIETAKKYHKGNISASLAESIEKVLNKK